jgi:predicted glutamine amidotransferase
MDAYKITFHAAASSPERAVSLMLHALSSPGGTALVTNIHTKEETWVKVECGEVVFPNEPQSNGESQ